MSFRHQFISILTALCIAMTFTAASADQIKSDTPPEGNFYVVSPMAPFGVWDQPGYPERYERGAKLSTYKLEFKKDQQFYFLADGDGWYHIRTANGSGAVTLEGNKNKDGVRLVIWDYDFAANNQKFLVQHQGNGEYKIFTAYGRCVTVANRSCANDSAVHTWGNHDGKWMHWQFKMAADGTVYNPDTKKNADAAKGDLSQPKKYGTLKDVLAGTKIAQQYFTKVTTADFEKENSGKLLQTWMDGLSRNDQLTAYSDLLSDASNGHAAEAIFRALSEVSLKPGKGFTDNMAKKLLRKQYDDAAKRQKDAKVRTQLEAIVAKLK